MAIYEFEGKRPSIGKDSFIHPQAVVIGEVELGERCYVGAGAVIRGDYGKIAIGSGTNIQENCILHSEPETIAIIEENSLIGHSAIIHGPCLIKENVTVGMGAIVCAGCELETNSLLAAGSVLPPGHNVPKGKIAMGNGTSKGAFGFCTFFINMDPLMVECSISKLIDLFLGYGQVF